ncbi:MAG: septal ring lytic transglycosylase RlpA family protein [Pontixanthobacter sp.]
MNRFLRNTRKPFRIKLTRRRTGVMAMALLTPLPLASYAGAEDSTATIAFDDSFEQFAELPEMPEADGNVVDIADFTPPIEIVPEPAATNSLGTGIASYYGKRFHGRRTANGERFNMHELTAAHKTLPFGTRVLVTNPRNGKTVTVRINDRGPYAHGRTIDLSRAAAKKVGIVQRGHGKVELALLN